MLKRLVLSLTGIVLLIFAYQTGQAESRSKSDVVLTINPGPGKAQLHWMISNGSSVAVYVYSYYLYGPAYSVTRHGGTITLDTTPTLLESGCPYRFVKGTFEILNWKI
jgi:hypothetical protein